MRMSRTFPRRPLRIPPSASSGSPSTDSAPLPGNPTRKMRGTLRSRPSMHQRLSVLRHSAAVLLSRFETLARYLAKAIPEWHDPVYLYEQRGERVNNAWNYLKYMAWSTRDRRAVRALYETAFPRIIPERSRSFPFGERCGGSLPRRLHMNEWFQRGNVLPHIIGQNDPVWIGDFGRARPGFRRLRREKRHARSN